MFQSDPPLIILSGPTAVGKSSLAVELAQKLNGEVISADSMQVYRGMDIGTAKIKQDEMQGIPHHLIDVCDLSALFNVVSFVQEAKKAIQTVRQKERVPILVGGTGFYIHALLYGEPEGPPADFSLRKELEKRWDNGESERIKEQLKEIDPEYFKTISSGDRRKMIRGLEIYESTNKPPSFFKGFQRDQQMQDSNCLPFFLHMERPNLYERINLRVEQMVEEGLIDEVSRLIPKGLKKNLTASQAIGYRQVLQYFSGHFTTEEELTIEIQKVTRRYAKRQMTWFRSDPNFSWVEVKRALETILGVYETSYATHVV